MAGVNYFWCFGVVFQNNAGGACIPKIFEAGVLINVEHLCGSDAICKSGCRHYR
jgi:hypothetical protein